MCVASLPSSSHRMPPSHIAKKYSAPKRCGIFFVLGCSFLFSNQANQGSETRSRMRIRFCSRIRIRSRLVGAILCNRPVPVPVCGNEKREWARIQMRKWEYNTGTGRLHRIAPTASPLLEFATRNSYNSYLYTRTSNSLPAHCRSYRQGRWDWQMKRLRHSDR